MGLAVVLLTGVVTGGVALGLSSWIRAVADSGSRWLRSGMHVVLAALFGAGGAALARGWVELVAFAVLAVACGLLVVIDLAVHRLPDVIVGPTYLVVFGAFVATALLVGSWPDLARAAGAALCVGGGYFLLALVAPSGLGLGDVKLAGLLGAFLGWQGWPEVIVGTVAAFLVNGLAVALLLLAGKVTRRSAVAFGPWMVAGAVIGVLWSPAVL